MEKDIDPKIIKATQSSLGKFVKRPPLTEKLLKKPPFRFLHDIVTSVLKTTGFFDGLFDEEELVSDNVKERENKLVFLNKVITVVGLTTGKTLAVKASKIIAGQEPDKTNELLQCIAHALEKNLSSEEAVKQFKEGKITKPDEKRSKESLKQTKKSNESNKLTSKSSERLTGSKKEPGTRSSSKNDPEKTNIIKTKKEKSSKTESPPKKTTQNTKLLTSKKPSIEKKKIENLQDPKSGLIENIAVDLDVIDQKKVLKTDIENQLRMETEELATNPGLDKPSNLDNSYTIVENGLNSSLSSQDLMEAENVNAEEHDKIDRDVAIDVQYSQPVEPLTEKRTINDNVTEKDHHGQGDTILNSMISPDITAITKKPDFYKEEEKINSNPSVTKSPSKTIIRPPSVRPSSSRPGAPRPRDKHDNMIIEAENIVVGKVNIITENAPNEEEEDASIVIIEKDSNDTQTLQQDHEQLHASHNEHGHLVQQILESQKEYSQMSGKTEIEWQFGAKKARDALNKEIEQVRFDIQALSRVANPLGKVMDHIQEDVEVMRQELNQWTKTYEETSKELIKQKAANEDSLFPLYAKVKQLGADIEEKHDKITDLKIIIHKNSQRIDKLLANGTVQ